MLENLKNRSSLFIKIKFCYFREFWTKFFVLMKLSGSGSAGSARQRGLQSAGAQRQRDLLHAAGTRTSEEQDLQAPGDAVLDESANGIGPGARPAGYLSQSQAALADDLLHRASGLSDTPDHHSRSQSTPLLVSGGLFRYRSLERDVPAAADRCEPPVAAAGVPRLLDIPQLLRHGSLQGVVQTLFICEEATGIISYTF